jgi:hypothetical protein
VFLPQAARQAKLKEEEARQKAFQDAKRRVRSVTLLKYSFVTLCRFPQMKEEAEQKARDEEARVVRLREEAERAAREKVKAQTASFALTHQTTG